ncbi:hypothetical protein HYZ05_02070 [Candidatus Daviesbacteria bacterium]|nr:hypothetical protein [Candidatus Daviesbacteria bacterium]
MDNNNPTDQIVKQPAPAAQNPVVPETPAPVPTAPPVEEGKSKMILWLIGGVIVVIIVVGGIYWYLSNQAAKQAAREVKAPQAVTREETSLETDLDTVQIGDIDSEFINIDQDLESL